jgi:hypothetical protein
MGKINSRLKGKTGGPLIHGDRGGAKRNTGGLYAVWRTMKSRCYNKNHISYHTYKNVKVCSKWINNYVLFKEWALKNGYKKGLYIDRINNNSGYNSKNCRWVTPAESSRNKRNLKLNARAVKKIRSEYVPYKITYTFLAEKYNVSKGHIRDICQLRRWKNV